MPELTQLERATVIASNFESDQCNEGCFVYIYLGEASLIGYTQTEILGQTYNDAPIWDVNWGGRWLCLLRR